MKKEKRKSLPERKVNIVYKLKHEDVWNFTSGIRNAEYIVYLGYCVFH